MQSLHVTVMALKELTETMAGQRGGREDHSVTWGEMPTIPQTGGDVRWYPLPFVNGWVDYGTPFTPSGFRKLPNGLVLLRGLVKNGTASQICTMPPGYRPGIRGLFAGLSNEALCRIDVDAGGGVFMTLGINAWVSLNNVIFLAEN